MSTPKIVKKSTHNCNTIAGIFDIFLSNIKSNIASEHLSFVLTQSSSTKLKTIPTKKMSHFVVSTLKKLISESINTAEKRHVFGDQKYPTNRFVL